MRRLSAYILGFLLIGWLIQPASVAHAAATAGWYNNNDSQISYSSPQDWTYLNGSTYSLAMNSDISTTTVPGARIDFTFSGSSVTYWYTLAYNRGSYRVYIDGVYFEEVSANTTGVRRQIGRTWTVANPNLSHLLSIVFVPTPSGTILDIDAFSVDVQTYKIDTDGDNNDPAIRRFGTWIQADSQGTFIDVDRIYSNQDYLKLDYIPQYQTNWCWADVSQVVGQYMTASKMSSPFLGTVSNNDTRQNILNKQPIIERWEWPAGDPAVGHFVIIMGVNDQTGTYRVQVPRDVGITTDISLDLTYAQLLSGTYVGNNKHYSWNGYVAWIYR